MADYAHPEMLVSTDWVAEHAGDENVRVVEVDVDTSAYDEGHIAGAIGWAWNTQLCDTVQRDIIPKEDFENRHVAHRNERLREHRGVRAKPRSLSPGQEHDPHRRWIRRLVPAQLTYFPSS